jgi:hypothetical protein
MPFAIDEEKFNAKPGQGGLTSLDPATPPTKQIPHLEYPRVVYKHPREPFRMIEHRNTLHEVVDVEKVPSEHLTQLVNTPEELEKALADGWVKEAYIAPPLPDPNARLYDSSKTERRAK